VSAAKRDELIEMPFAEREGGGGGGRLEWAEGGMYYMAWYIGATWRIHLNDVCVGDAASRQLTLTTCLV